MRKKLIISGIMMILCLFIVVNFNFGSDAYSGGSNDSNKECSCTGSCHSEASGSSTISIESNTNTVMAGTELQVTVHVTNTEQAEGESIGVFLLSSFEGGKNRCRGG